MQSYKKIIAIKTRRLGDTVLWTAALHALRESFPQSVIHLGVPSSYASLFQDDPRFQKVISIDVKGPMATGWSLRKERYDLLLGFHAGPSLKKLARYSGAKTKVLHHHGRTPDLYGSQLPIPHLGHVMPATERDLNVVRALGWSGISPSPRLHFSDEVRGEALRTLKGLGWDEKRPIVFFHPGASRPSKQWGIDNYFKTIELIPHSAFPILIIDDRKAMAREEAFLQKIERRIPLFSTRELVKLAAVLSWGKVFVGSDSGIKHLACAAGIHTVTLFGPESIGEWHCYDQQKHPVIQKAVGCRNHDPIPSEFAWCGEASCPLSSHSCMTLIFPEEVLTKIQPFL